MVTGADGSLSTEELEELVAQSEGSDRMSQQDGTATDNLPTDNGDDVSQEKQGEASGEGSTKSSSKYFNDFAHTNLALLLDVTMHVTVEIGRAKMRIEDVLKLGPGSIVELDKLNGEPVDIRVNNRLIGQGEVVAVGETFGVKIHSIIELKKRFAF